MKCKICGINKLSKEFWMTRLADDCQHPPTHCMSLGDRCKRGGMSRYPMSCGLAPDVCGLWKPVEHKRGETEKVNSYHGMSVMLEHYCKCVIDKLSSGNACPYGNCGRPVVDADAIVNRCRTDLDLLYPSGDACTLLDAPCGNIKVVMLTGEFAVFPFSPTMTVMALKLLIFEKFKVNPDNQQLIYEEAVLEEMKGENEATLADYKVESLRTILLMVLMYAIPRDFNHVTFDLSWGFPDQKCDALDATCLIFSGKSCVGVVDYCQTEYGKRAKAVWHSGDDMDQVKKTGRHTIDAKLKEIPLSVTHLYFTLSAWNSPTIAHYRDPCLKFFEASNKQYNLCQTTFTHALDSPAVIMCSVVRNKDQWKIFACGQCSAGNAKDYEPLKTSIQKLIKTDSAPAATDKSLKVASNLVDLVFAMDCTGSMGKYIATAQQNIKAIADDIVRQVGGTLRLALVEYRDHPPQDKTFITRVLDFTESVAVMKQRLDGCNADGGGDVPEAVADALNDLLKLSWRPISTKICVFVSDAPPHGINCDGDKIAEGCPLGHDPMLIANQLASQEIIVYMVGCEPSILPYKDWFMAIAHITGGQYVPLASAQALTSVIVAGTLEEISLTTLLKDVTAEVKTLQGLQDGSVNQAEFEARVFEKVKGMRTKKVASGSTELPKPTPKALELAKLKSLAEVRRVFTPGYSSSSTTTSTSTSASFSAVEGDVTRSQVSRMVQRVLMTSGLKSKMK